MIEPQVGAVVLLVPAGAAAFAVFLGRRWKSASRWEFGFTIGYVCGFLALRVLRAVAAASHGSPDSFQILSAAREQTVRLWSPRAVGDWLPLLAVTIWLWACTSAAARQRWLQRLLWFGQTITFAGFLAVQYRKTRYFALPRPESTSLLVQAGAVALIGWITLTWRWNQSMSAVERLHRSWVGRIGVMGTMSIACGVVLCGLQALSGSLSLATEAALVPAALAGTLMGGLCGAHKSRNATNSLLPRFGGEGRVRGPSAPDDLLTVAEPRDFSPHFPSATWTVLSLSYVLQGLLLAHLSPTSSWLWTAAAAIALGGWFHFRASQSRVRKLLPTAISTALLALATGLAARQFWLDTH